MTTDRLELAWLLWATQQGYLTPEDRAGHANWMRDSEDSMTPNDISQKNSCLSIADTLISVVKEELKHLDEKKEPKPAPFPIKFPDGWDDKWQRHLDDDKSLSRVIINEIVTYDENTLHKVRTALEKTGLCEWQVNDAIREMQNAGILFRERM